MNLNVSNLIAGLIFGTIGFSAFIYGKKQASAKPMVIGISLMAFPYFVSNNWVLWISGSVLTILLFFP